MAYTGKPPGATRLERHHIIQNRKMEVALAILLMLSGLILIYDAYDARGRKMPWPIGGLMPW